MGRKLGSLRVDGVIVFMSKSDDEATSLGCGYHILIGYMRYATQY